MSKINVSVTDGTNVNLTVSPRPVQTITVSRGSTGGGGGIGTVTEVTANAPLSVTNGTTTPDLSIAAATDSVSGYLTSTDHATFNAKVGSITSTDGSITVTGTTTRDLIVNHSPNVLVEVRNNTGATLTKGTAVYINGAIGQLPTITKAQANSDASSAQTLGLMTTDLANNANGYVTIIGLITNINTSAYTDGQQLYLSPTVAGGLTATKPQAPQHLVYVAVVEHAHITQGKLFVKVQNGYELDELHDVQIISPTNGQTLTYDSATSLWKNTTPAAGTITGSGTTNYVTKFTGTSAIGNSVIFDDGTNVGVGTSSPSAVSGYTSVTVNGTTGSLLDNYVNGTLTGRISVSSNTYQMYAQGASTYLAFGTNAAERMRIDSSGNVGINLPNPLQRLHVQGTSTSSTITNLSDYSGIYLTGDIAGTSRVGLSFSSAGGGGAAVVFGRGGNYNTNISFFTNLNTNASGAMTERMVIADTGAVGIGTSSPAAKLDVAVGHIRLDDDYSFYWGDASSSINGNSTSDFVRIFTNSAERMRIDSSGNVGIGTTSPTVKLDVNGGVSCTTLSASSTVSGTGFSNYLASPPAIGGTTPSTITGTTVTAKSISGTNSSFVLQDPVTTNVTCTFQINPSTYNPTFIATDGVDSYSVRFATGIAANPIVLVTDGTTVQIDITAPAGSGYYILTLPTTAGSANQVLKTDGSGNLSWTNKFVLGAGTATAGTAPLKFTSGTNLTTAEAGAMEYDGKVAYFTPSGTARALNFTPYYFRNNSQVTLNNATGNQSILGLTNGVTLAASTIYEVECEFKLTTSGTTSHTEAFGFAGTATANNVHISMTRQSSFLGTGTAGNGAWFYTTIAVSTVTAAITTAQEVTYKMRGNISVNASGTFNPMIAFSAAPGGTSTIAAGAWFRVTPLGASGSNISIGTWT